VGTLAIRAGEWVVTGIVQRIPALHTNFTRPATILSRVAELLAFKAAAGRGNKLPNGVLLPTYSHGWRDVRRSKSEEKTRIHLRGRIRRPRIDLRREAVDMGHWVAILLKISKNLLRRIYTETRSENGTLRTITKGVSDRGNRDISHGCHTQQSVTLEAGGGPKGHRTHPRGLELQFRRRRA
jgi:hypothetical protein